VCWRNVDRTLFYDQSTAIVDQNDVAIVIRYGLTNNATVAAEVMAAPGDLVNEENVERFYTVGASLRTLIWKHDPIVVSTGVHYTSSYWRRVPNACDRETQLIEWELLVEWSSAVGSQPIAAWAGPILSHFSFANRAPCDDDYWEPSEMLGVTFGVNVVLWSRLEIDGQFVWVENPEPRVGVAYRF
jgi:hypothetical protein